jgi:glycosyltransferase involved in cell wall biosynthesis
MISGENIIYFGPEKWEGMWRNRHHLMSRFSHQNRVLYVEPTGYLKNVRAELKRDPLKWWEFFHSIASEKLRQEKTNLYVYQSDRNIPITRRYPFEKLTWQLWLVDFKRTLSKLDFKNPIIWLSKPSMRHYIRCFREKLSIYHVVDEYTAYANVSPEKRKISIAAERQMMQMADMVIVVSQSLFKNKSPFNEHTYLVPNAVDYEAYATLPGDSRDIPVDMKHVNNPFIGYSGLISNRLDIELMNALARQKPAWSIVLIGRLDDRDCKNSLAELIDRPNVFYLGLKDIQDVPNYIHAFDVCILPYRENNETKNLSALKMYDYLAAGKPIVTTHFPEVEQYSNVVRISSSPTEFITHLSDALENDTSDLAAERQQIASANTWDERVERVSDLIHNVVSTQRQT